MLRNFWTQPGRGDAEQPLRAWFSDARRTLWQTPADIRQHYASASASFLADNRVCFNIGGNKYRLIVLVLYRTKTVYIRFIGTHDEYDRIDADKA